MTSDPWWLKPDEQVFWSGQPVVWRFLWKRHDAPYVVAFPVFGAVLIAYLLWTKDSFVALLQVALCALVAYLVFVGLKSVWLAKRTLYVLTDQRALTHVGHKSQSIWIKDVGSIRVRRDKSEVGDIIFKETLVRGSESQWIRDEGFFSIRDVSTVEMIVRDLIEKNTSGAAAPARS